MKDEMRDVSDNSWYAWSKTVLLQLEQDTHKLDKHEACLQEVKRLVTDLRIDVAQLKVKAGIWGLIGGIIPVAIGLGVWLLKGKP
jgi:hypothetical protein